jgi:hypothetical protein
MNRDERTANVERVNATDAMLIVTFIALITCPILSIIRFLDNNTLTSWKWIVPQSSIGLIFLFLVVGIALSAVLSLKPLPERPLPAILFLFSFLAVMPLWTVPEVMLDASRYFLQAKHLELYGIGSFFREWGHDIGAWTDLPLIPFFYGLIFKYFGEVRLYIQLFTTLLFSLTVLLTYLIGKTLWNRETGLYAGLLLLGIPYLLTQVPLMLVDVPSMFFVTLSIFVFLTALEKGGGLRITSAALSLFLCVLVKYSALLLLLVMPIIVFVSYKIDPFRKLARAATVLSLAILLCGLFFVAQYDVVMTQIDLLRTYQWQGLKRWQEGLASTLLFQIHPLITLAASISIVAAARKRDIRFLIPAWFVLVVLFHHGRIRYLLPLFPLLTLMASYGIQELRHAGVRRYFVLSIIASSLVIAIFAYAPFLRRTSMVNLRDAGGYIDSLEGSAVEVLVLPQKRSLANTEMAIPILDLYTRKNIVYKERLAAPQDQQAIRRSPLRFSWEIRLPAVYSEQKMAACLPLVVISSDSAGTASSDMTPQRAPLRLLNRFESTTGVFKYKNIGAVFKGTCMSETAQ